MHCPPKACENHIKGRLHAAKDVDEFLTKKRGLSESGSTSKLSTKPIMISYYEYYYSIIHILYFFTYYL